MNDKELTQQQQLDVVLDLREKLTSQAARIAELEAALCEEVEARSKWYCEADRLKEELAALRRKIDEAPVVAWSYTSKISGNETLAHQPPDRVIEPERFEIRPLISKEDLK